MSTEEKTEKPVKSQETDNSNKYEGYPVSMRQLLESGVHFGHQRKRWDPRMAPYIYTARNDIHVIDLQKTIECVKQAYDFIKEEVSKNRGRVLFVGTKKQAKEAVLTEAQRAGMPYINQRWWGGTLTNNHTIQKSIRLLKKLEADEESGFTDSLPKKEAATIRRKLAKLRYFIGGIKDLNALPSVIVVIDTKKEQLAITEAKKLGIKIVGLVDTNADPTEIDFPIPGNDDAIRSVKLICSVMADAVVTGKDYQVEKAPTARPVDVKPAEQKEMA